jgi:phosphatidylglycerol:prolipoprotein diacylglycerol transferase
MEKWYFNPVMVQIGPLQIHWYGVMYAIAFVLAYLYLHNSKHGKSLPLTSDQKDLFLALAIGGVLVGGRLGYVLFYNLPYYLQNPLKIFAVWEGGMSFHGGLLAVAAITIWFSKKYKIGLLELGDVECAIAPLGLFFGRIGNFINGELYGRIATQFCLYFPSDPQNCRYPSQLFEAVFEGLVLFALLWFLRKKDPRPGVVSCAFLFFYGIFRFVIEFFREPDPQIGFFPGGFTEGQLLCFLMILCGVLLWFFMVRGNKRPAKHPAVRHN